MRVSYPFDHKTLRLCPPPLGGLGGGEVNSETFGMVVKNNKTLPYTHKPIPPFAKGVGGLALVRLSNRKPLASVRLPNRFSF